MPSHNSLRFDDEKSISPPGLDTSEKKPEKAIQFIQDWSWFFILEYCHLLAKG
jgi:hypothetical protein